MQVRYYLYESSNPKDEPEFLREETSPHFPTMHQEVVLANKAGQPQRYTVTQVISLHPPVYDRTVETALVGVHAVGTERPHSMTAKFLREIGK